MISFNMNDQDASSSADSEIDDFIAAEDFLLK
jgi:hypothetical protein